MMLRSRRFQMQAIAAALVALVIILLVLSLSRHSTPKGGNAPSKDVLAVAGKYIQAREDSNGADQASPVSWLDSVKDISTKNWFSKLQPPADPSAGAVPYNFTIARQNNYVIKAVLTGCIWDDILSKPSEEHGVVLCNLEDKTIDTSGREIPAASLPFGWTAVGKQQAPQLVMLHQGSKWLVDADITGQAQ